MDDLTEIANSPKPLPKFRNGTDGFSRQKVVQAFAEAFQLIGGVNRLTLWANQNPGEFYKLYTKLMPASTIQIGVGEKVIIEHALGPTALDIHPDQTFGQDHAHHQESVPAPSVHAGVPPAEQAIRHAGDAPSGGEDSGRGE